MNVVFMEINADQSEKRNYNYAGYPIYIQEGHLSDYPDYRALAHWHDDVEVMYILSGEIQYNINGQVITIRQGNGVMINTRQMHFGFSSHQTDCTFICLRIHPMLLCMNAAYEQDFVIPILTDPHLSYIYLDQDIKWHAQILKLVSAVNDIKESKAAPLKIHSYFLQIWALLAENISCTKDSRVNNSDFSILKEMLRFIQCSYAEKISLSEIAAAGAVGQSKCCQLFTKYLGQTPNNYLVSYRLQKCTELLKNTDMTVTEIALAIGFGGSSYLAETFRKKYGMTPTQYKKIKN